MTALTYTIAALSFALGLASVAAVVVSARGRATERVRAMEIASRALSELALVHIGRAERLPADSPGGALDPDEILEWERGGAPGLLDRMPKLDERELGELWSVIVARPGGIASISLDAYSGDPDVADRVRAAVRLIGWLRQPAEPPPPRLRS